MQYVPSSLYKYRPLGSMKPGEQFEDKLLNRVCNEIAGLHLYAPDVYMLNDPFEGAGVVPYAATMGSSIPVSLGFLPSSAMDYTYGLRLISMTECYDSPQMWAHYATNYCGVCLCFDTGFLEGRIDAVRYSDTPIVEHGYRADDLRFRKDELAPSALLVKQRDWAYEQEWRAILSAEDTDNGYVAFSKNDLWAVIVGHNTPPEAISAIKDVCASIGASVYITAPLPMRYKLAIWPIDFQPVFDGRSIEQELSAFCEQAGAKTFEQIAYGNRRSMEQARERVFAKARSEEARSSYIP